MKIGVIFTGGTIGSQHSDHGIEPNGMARRRLLSSYRERTGDGYVFPTVEPYTILSENLDFSYVGKLATCIRERIREWDGIIVTHGTDTLQYTAAALSYMLGLDFPPVVLVSSNFTLTDPRANGLDNFCGAVDFLRADSAARGVYVAYRNAGEPTLLHRATRLLPHHALDDKLFSIGGALATVAANKIHPVSGYSEQPDGQKPFAGTDLSSGEGQVLFLRAHPGMVYPALDGIAAVLLEAFHSGTLATDSPALRRFAADAQERHVPLFVAGVPNGGTAYASGNLFEELGLIPAPPLSPVAVYCKLCLALADKRDPRSALWLPLGGDM